MTAEEERNHELNVGIIKNAVHIGILFASLEKYIEAEERERIGKHIFEALVGCRSSYKLSGIYTRWTLCADYEIMN